MSGIVFALLHSMLAHASSKRVASNMGIGEQHYRLYYSLFAVLSTGIWLMLVHNLSDQRLYQLQGLPMLIAMALQLTGLMVLLLTFREFDGLVFLGLKKAVQVDNFQESGVYCRIRHPMYSGVMLMIFASPMQSINSLNLCLVVSLYFVLGSRLEERRMLRMFPEYADYQKRVPAFIPMLGCSHVCK